MERLVAPNRRYIRIPKSGTTEELQVEVLRRQMLEKKQQGDKAEPALVPLAADDAKGRSSPVLPRMNVPVDDKATALPAVPPTLSPVRPASPAPSGNSSASSIGADAVSLLEVRKDSKASERHEKSPERSSLRDRFRLRTAKMPEAVSRLPNIAY